MPRFSAAQDQPVLSAPAEYGSYQEARTDTISQVKVPTLSGEPR